MKDLTISEKRGFVVLTAKEYWQLLEELTYIEVLTKNTMDYSRLSENKTKSDDIKCWQRRIYEENKEALVKVKKLNNMLIE